MIDTHTHLYLPEFEEPSAGENAVRRALLAGVEKMIFPNVDLSTIKPMEQLAAKFPNSVYCAMGLHPTEVATSWRDDLSIIFDRFEINQSYVAVGEVGIDLYWDKTHRHEQVEAFAMQVDKAITLDLPVIIHCREGLEEVIGVLRQFPQARAVFHSFGGTIEDVENIRKVGDYYFGINGIVTFKNSKLRDVLPVIGLERLLLETDSPYLAPVPKRGKRNESAFLPYICAHIAQALNLTASQVDGATTSNACMLFKL